MDAVRIVDAGEQLVISGADRAAVQAVLDDLARRGATILCPVTPLGSRFNATATHPTAPPESTTQDPSSLAELERIAAMRSVSISDAGTHLILTGNDRATLERALQELGAKGLNITSAIAPMGARWIASCEHPEHVQAPCKVETLGLKAVLSARRREQVDAKIEELCRGGASVLAAPELIDGFWTAIVDLGERQAGMRFY